MKNKYLLACRILQCILNILVINLHLMCSSSAWSQMTVWCIRSSSPPCLCHIAVTCTSWRNQKKLMRAGVVGEEGGGGGGAGGVRQDEIEDGGRNQSTEKEREREKLLDRLLLIRGCLAPYHYVRRNPFSFAQICLEFFLFSLASIIRAGNQISLWLFSGSLANISPCGQRRWLGLVLAFC